MATKLTGHSSLEMLLATSMEEIRMLLQHYDQITAERQYSQAYYRHRQQCINELVRLCSGHWYVGEAVVLPALDGILPVDRLAVIRGRLHDARTLLDRLSAVDVDDAGYTELLDQLRQFLALEGERETDWLYHIVTACTSEQLDALTGAAMTARATAPTRPHPELPDAATSAGRLANLVAASMDRIRDYGREFDSAAHRSVSGR